MLKHTLWYRFLVLIFSCFLTYQWTWMPVAQAQGSGTGSGGDTSIDCSNTKTNSERRASGCNEGTHGFQDQGGYATSIMFTTIIAWAAAAVLIFIVGQCLTNLNSCSMGSLLGAVGAGTLIAGEIAAMVKNTKFATDTVQYRADLLKKYKTECEAGKAPPISETKGINVCDSFDSLKAQREAYVEMKGALELKAAMYIAAVSSFGIAAIMDYYSHIDFYSKLQTLKTAVATARTTCNSAPDVTTAPATANCSPTAKPCANTLSGFEQVTDFAAGNRNYAEDIARLTAAAAGGQAPTPEATDEATGAATNAATSSVSVGALGFMDKNINEVYLSTPSSDRRRKYQQALQLIQLDFASSCQVAVTTCAVCQATLSPVNSALTTLQPLINCTGSNCVLGGNTPSTPPVTTHWTPEEQNQKYFSWMNSLMDVANADDRRQGQSASNIVQWIASGLGLVVVIIFLVLIIKNWAAILDRFWTVPLGRGVLYTVLAVLVGGLLVIVHTVQIPIVQKNIESIDKILAMSGLGTVDLSTKKVKNISLDGISLPSSVFEEEIPISSEENKAPCIYGGNGKGSCLHAPENSSVRLSGQGLGSMASGVNAVNQVERAISGRNTMSREGLNGAQELGKIAGAVRKRLLEVKGQLNQKLKANGKAPINFDALEKQAYSRFMTSGQQIMNTKEGKGVMEAAAKGIGAGLLDEKSRAAIANEIKSDLKASAAAINSGSEFEYTGTEELLTAGGDTGLQAGLEPEQVDLSMKSVKDEGIFNNPDANIFEQVSVRYLKSAYPVLFNEEK